MNGGWWTRGECTKLPPEEGLRLFFPDPSDAVAIAKARSICYQCTVRAECLTDAVLREERHGVWGGRFFEKATAARKVRCPRCASTDLLPWGSSLECVSCGYTWPR